MTDRSMLKRLALKLACDALEWSAERLLRATIAMQQKKGSLKRKQEGEVRVVPIAYVFGYPKRADLPDAVFDPSEWN